MAKSEEDLRKNLRRLIRFMYLEKSYSDSTAADKLYARIKSIKQRLGEFEEIDPIEEPEASQITTVSPRVTHFSPIAIHFCPSCGERIVKGQQVVTYGAVRLCNYRCLRNFMFESVPEDVYGD